MHEDASTPESELLSALVGLVGNWSSSETQGRIARAVGVGIAEGDVRALYTIGLRGGRLRPAALADELRITRPTTSKALARLAAAGLIVRDRTEGDGRGAWVALTPAGQDAHRRLVAAGIDMVRAALDGCSAEDAAALTALVRRLTVGLGATAMPGDPDLRARARA